jgi:hypothetical protein
VAQWKNQTLFPGDSGYFLLAKISSQFKPSNVLDYSNARIKMYKEIYNQNDTIFCVYSGHSLYLDPLSPDPIGYLSKNGNANGINCEHTFPQSKGADQGNARSDMHHLFPARAAVNEARSNFPYAEIEDRKTQSWFYKNSSINTIPQIHIDWYSESTSNAFEPREDHKGNVARAIFYFMAIYDLQADRTFFEMMKPTLCDWHESDPVDSTEWSRSQMIGKYQEGKANPFVLDCSLARRTFCPQLPDCSSFTATRSIPNLIVKEVYFSQDNHLNIELSQEEHCQVFICNPMGQIFYAETFSGTEKHILTTHWPPGLYLVKMIINNHFHYFVRLVKP